MKCKIQWLSKQGQPTPDENEAVAMAHIHHMEEESMLERSVRYKSTICASIPICQQHLDTVTYTMHYANGGGWEFTPLD